jgi:hypothetical protein
MTNSHFIFDCRGARLFSVVGRHCVSVALLCLLLNNGPVIRAQSDNFNGGNDAGWTHYDPLGTFGAPATYSVSRRNV